MSNKKSLDETLADMSREEIFSALFQNLVAQQTNMAFMFLGRIPNPQTGEHMHDLDAARLFIEHLEMLEFKTRNNLEKEESEMLKQSLTALRMAFVEAVESPASSKQTEEGTPAREDGLKKAPEPEPKTDDDRKKFSKKY